ncbi:MAG: hypothetical protein MUC76_08180 [Spirochaetes bacterium]|jgi:hypothetical protein|nr:hypothetical protein [Spirochaetota bacterium]
MAAREKLAAGAYAAANDEDHTLAIASFDRRIGPVVNTDTIVGFLE